MLSELDFDKAEFLKRGAVFAKKDQVWLLWGEPSSHQSRPEAIAVYFSDFHKFEGTQWLLYPFAMQVDWEEARNIFCSSHVERNWQGVSRKNFEIQYEIIQKAFREDRIEKLVPYVFDCAEGSLTSEELENALHSALNQNKGYLYGQWNSSSGFLGLTPEILISQHNAKSFESMALAGTYPLDEYEKNPQAFLDDSKEQVEHLKVVEDIVDGLSDYGIVEAENIQVETTPHLAHLKTPIFLQLKKSVSLEHLVKRLHPTPALGGVPRKEAKGYLKRFEELEPRGIFGAPFGISFSQTSADFVVAIRNIIWNEKEVKIGTGCGVVKQSELDKEWKELTNKRESVKRIFGLKRD